MRRVIALLTEMQRALDVGSPAASRVRRRVSRDTAVWSWANRYGRAFGEICAEWRVAPMVRLLLYSRPWLGLLIGLEVRG